MHICCSNLKEPSKINGLIILEGSFCASLVDYVFANYEWKNNYA